MITTSLHRIYIITRLVLQINTNQYKNLKKAEKTHKKDEKIAQKTSYTAGLSPFNIDKNKTRGGSLVNKSLQTQANEEELIRHAKAEYMRAWRQKNREKVLAYNREWRKRNKDKVREYNRRYWLKKAKEKLN